MTDDLACASSVALRPSQLTGAAPAWPIPSSVCDRREVSFAGIVALCASVTAQPSCGRWPAHAGGRAGGGHRGIEEQLAAEVDKA